MRTLSAVTPREEAAQLAWKIDRILRPREAAQMLGICRITLWKWTRDGIFPPPIKIGPAAIGWRLSTLNLYLDGKTGGAS
jgi:prophage regulatory protein